VLFYVDAGGPPVGRAVTLRVVGADDEKRKEISNQTEGFLKKTPGVKDIDRDDKPGKEQITINMDYNRLARLDLTVSDVAQSVRIAYDGQVVTSIRQGDEKLPERKTVRLPN
jgi:Cu/Ag efflux pump CusA